ncbi:MAG: AbrB/MazE/SpoVT family DNA-binding domain-containing protein [Candidatus Electryonea clarkiae]|nr:AbrB/MazE/SpoVT family DNA-binding domain-containing protein [Candidatus Electryonea clarkiae]MDP8288299.1 AbrB/MazE/SpoVT family DNA-binding domain-containing protein [Candidatus Electryonea clarkiae]
MTEIKITSKGQVTLPKVIRDHLNIQPGDKVVFRIQPDGFVIVEPIIPIQLLRGFVKTEVKGVTLNDMKQAILEEGSNHDRS